MKFQPSLDVVPEQFVGNSAEEAVARARAALGADAKVRCWKTRRGGVLGFFAREVFVAGMNEPSRKAANSDRATKPKAPTRSEEPTPPTSTVRTRSEEPTPPPSKERTRPEGSRPHQPKERKRSIKSTWPQSKVRKKPGESTPPLSTPPEEAPPQSMPLGLDDLVSSTNDEVSFQSSECSQSEREFGDVLAQAEAALSEVVFDDAAWNDEETVEIVPIEPEPRDEIEEFRVSLGSLGLPAWYQPLEHEGVLDGLAKSLRDLPSPPDIPMTPGAVIVVVGSRREAGMVAQEIAEQFGLSENDVIAHSDSAVVRRRIARRRKSTRASIVILVAPPSGRGLSGARESLALIAPDYVLGAVPATAKGSDIERWCNELEVNAIALRHWDQTETPAELVSSLPILSVDGVMMSNLRWVSLLLSTHLGRNETA